MSKPTLGQSIRQDYEQNFNHPFPLSDVLKLKELDPFNWNRLHSELDLYFSSLAGYAYRADRLERRPKNELSEAKAYLSRSFFEKHPSLNLYARAVTEEQTPDLFRRLLTAERLRKQLLVAIEDVLEGRAR